MFYRDYFSQNMGVDFSRYGSTGKIMGGIDTSGVTPKVNRIALQR